MLFTPVELMILNLARLQRLYIRPLPLSLIMLNKVAIVLLVKAKVTFTRA